jgi:hypothetical protein
MDQAVAKLERSVTQTLVRRFRIPLGTRNALPDIASMSTNASIATFQLVQANANQVSTADPPSNRPSALPSTAASLQIHESALENLLSCYLAGQRLDTDQIASLVQELLGIVPEALLRKADQEPWTISFVATRPVVIQFNENQFDVSIHATDFLVGDDAYPGAVIGARYQLRSGQDGLVGVRDGRLQVQLLDTRDKSGRRLGVRQQVFRSMVRRRFGGLFPADFQWSQVTLPEPWPEGEQLRVAQSNSSQGWFHLLLGLQREGRRPTANAGVIPYPTVP